MYVVQMCSQRLALNNINRPRFYKFLLCSKRVLYTLFDHRCISSIVSASPPFLSAAFVVVQLYCRVHQCLVSVGTWPSLRYTGCVGTLRSGPKLYTWGWGLSVVLVHKIAATKLISNSFVAMFMYTYIRMYVHCMHIWKRCCVHIPERTPHMQQVSAQFSVTLCDGFQCAIANP